MNKGNDNDDLEDFPGDGVSVWNQNNGLIYICFVLTIYCCDNRLSSFFVDSTA